MAFVTVKIVPISEVFMGIGPGLDDQGWELVSIEGAWLSTTWRRKFDGMATKEGALLAINRILDGTIFRAVSAEVE